MLTPREQVIENFGQYFESFKLPRILGRIFGLLLVTGQPMLGLDAIVGELAVSKASVSNSVRQLVAFKMIEKVTRPGDRRDYYRVSPNAHLNYLQLSMSSGLAFARLIEAATKLEDLTPETRRKLEQIEHLYEALSKQLSEFFQSYDFSKEG